MNLEENYDLIIASEPYKLFLEASKKAFLNYVFWIESTAEETALEFGFFNPKSSKIKVFYINAGVVCEKEESAPLSTENIKPLSLESLSSEASQIQGIVNKYLLENLKIDSLKKMYLLATDLDDNPVWKVTAITKSFKTVLINASLDGKELSYSEIDLFKFDKN
jgi:hypothetical protein